MRREELNIELKPHWEHFHHQADLGVRGVGETLAEAFALAALGLTATVTDISLVRPERPREIFCESSDRELLLYDWLNAIIFQMDTESMLFSRFEWNFFTDTRLAATIWGESINRGKHHPVVEPKGATMTELRVYLSENFWIAQCVIDV